MNKLDIEDRLQTLKNFLDEIMNVGDKAIAVIRESIYTLKEIPPADVPNTFNREQRIISNLDDLQWILHLLNLSKTRVDEEILNIKAPDITYLVREGRIGTDLINIEVYNRQQGKLEPLLIKQHALENTILYLKTLEENLNKYLYMLKDRLVVR